jgi:hypothetical protein
MAYISAVTESDDDLSTFLELQLVCTIGRTVVCRHAWSLEPGERIYTMCFDFGRVLGVQDFPTVPLRARLTLDGTDVLEKEAEWVLHQTYSELGQMKGGFLGGYYSGNR